MAIVEHRTIKLDRSFEINEAVMQKVRDRIALLKAEAENASEIPAGHVALMIP